MCVKRIRKQILGAVCVAALLAPVGPSTPIHADSGDGKGTPGHLDAVHFRAPAGDLPAAREIVIDGYKAAVLPNGRLVTPVGVEVSVDAPKPYGLTLTANRNMLATINSGASRFSVTLIRNLTSATPQIKRVDMNATFMGVVFSPDGSRFYAAGGENGNIWIGDTASEAVIGSVNLKGPEPPSGKPDW